MASEILAGTGYRAPRERALRGAARVFHGGENVLVSLALGAMAFLPIAEIALRSTLGFGISGSNAIVQHLTLVVAMLGAAIAAREGRLLSLSTGVSLLSGGLKAAASAFSGAVAAAVTGLLCIASVQFVVSEKQGGASLIGGFPVWAAQVILPIGFALVAARILWHSSSGWKGRLVAGLLAALIIWAASHPFLPPHDLVIPAIVALIVATILGAPVFTTLGGLALVFFWGEEVPIASIPVETYRMVVSPTLPTIPLFTLAGYFLAEGGASKRLVRVFQALTGRIRCEPRPTRSMARRRHPNRRATQAGDAGASRSPASIRTGRRFSAGVRGQENRGS